MSFDKGSPRGVPPAQPFEFVVVGHATRDLVGGEERPGGTVSYAAAVASALGLRTAIVTSAPSDFPIPLEEQGVRVLRQPSTRPTLFEHRFVDGRREQYVHSQAEPITAQAIPPAVAAAAVVLFGPVAGELDAGVATAFGGRTRGATVQGWLRTVAAGDRHLEAIAPQTWDSARLFGSLTAAFLSEDDLSLSGVERRDLLERWASQAGILVITRGAAGANLALDGRWFAIDAVPAVERDSTGAGDAFAAAFLIRYHETADADEAARFAAATAAFVVEAPGVSGAPGRERVLDRLLANPGVHLRARNGDA